MRERLTGIGEAKLGLTAIRRVLGHGKNEKTEVLHLCATCTRLSAAWKGPEGEEDDDAEGEDEQANRRKRGRPLDTTSPKVEPLLSPEHPGDRSATQDKRRDADDSQTHGYQEWAKASKATSLWGSKFKTGLDKFAGLVASETSRRSVLIKLDKKVEEMSSLVTELGEEIAKVCTTVVKEIRELTEPVRLGRLKSRGVQCLLPTSDEEDAPEHVDTGHVDDGMEARHASAESGENRRDSQISPEKDTAPDAIEEPTVMRCAAICFLCLDYAVQQ